jgi:hypothetical protein
MIGRNSDASRTQKSFASFLQKRSSFLKKRTKKLLGPENAK